MRKKLLIISAAIICTALIIMAVAILNSDLPDLPDVKAVPKPVQNQISGAARKAHFLPFAGNYGRLGMVLHSAGYYDEAAKCYNIAIRKDKKNPRWHYFLGYLNLEKSDTKGELENFREVIKYDPGNRMAMYYIADAFQGMNRTDEAEKYFLKVIETDNPILNAEKPQGDINFPIRIYAMYNLGRIYLNNGRLNEAEKILKSVLLEYPTFGSAYRLLGNVYAKTGDQLLSKKNLIRAKDHTDYSPPADPLIDELLLISRSESFLLKGIDLANYSHNFQWSQTLCEHALKYIPDNKFLLSKSIMVFMTTGKESQAYSLIEMHLKLSQKDFRDLLEMAEFFMSKNSKKIGILYYAAAKDLEPENAILPGWLRKWNLLKEATSVMKTQLDKDPENPKYLANASLVSIGMGEKENARKYIRKLIKIAPANLDALRDSGLIAYHENRIKEAIAIWKEVIKKDPTGVGTINTLNKLFKQKQMWNESFLIVQQGLENNPNDPALLNEMAELLVTCPDQKIRNLKDGSEYAERAYYNFYSNYNIKLSGAKYAGTAYLILGDKKMAEKFMNITLDLAQNGNLQQYLTYFDGLKKKYGLQ